MADYVTGAGDHPRGRPPRQRANVAYALQELAPGELKGLPRVHVSDAATHGLLAFAAIV